MDKPFFISENRSKDPEYWAYADLNDPDFEAVDDETQKELRSVMTAVALLHQKFPKQPKFSTADVGEHMKQARQKYPHLKPRRGIPEAC